MAFPTPSAGVLTHGSNALDIARDAFALLVTGPQPLAVDGRDFAGLPDRMVPLNEMRDQLLDGCTRKTRDAVWAHLVTRARTAGPAWTVGCVGVALPALLVVTDQLADGLPHDRDDIAAAVLLGFLDRLSTVELDRSGVVTRLRWAAVHAGYAARRDALPTMTRRAPGFRSQPPPLPWQHIDLVLLCAVADDILTPTETDLIGDTRLDRVRIEAWARVRNLNRDAVYKARARAERRLHAYLREQRLDSATGEERVASAGTLPLHHPTKHLAATPGPDCRQLAVSGRLRNGCAIDTESSVSKNGVKSGLQGRGHGTAVTGSRTSSAGARP